MAFELFNATFDAKLGTIKTCLCSDNELFVEKDRVSYFNGHARIFETSGHRIEVIEFKIRQPLYNGMTVTDSRGWIYRLKKTNDIHELLEVHCVFDNPVKKVNHGPSTGEALDAIEIWDDDKTWQINIGTEDGEALQSRAKNNDWMPGRFAEALGFAYSPTDYVPFGFKTMVPELKRSEKICFQYLTAVGKYDEVNIPTWFAVDETKRNLENYIGITDE